MSRFFGTTSLRHTHWLLNFYSFFLDKATNPSNRQEDWEHIMAFCERVNKDLEGYGHIVSISLVSAVISRI